MPGYWQNQEATDAILRDGFLHSGDVGYMDEDGYTFIVDRMKDMILAGGFNVYPRNIEEAVYEHPAASEAVLICIPDDYRGECPKVFYTVKPGSSVTAGRVEGVSRGAALQDRDAARVRAA